MTFRTLSVIALFAMAGAYSPATAQPAETCSVMVEINNVKRVEPVNGYVVTGAANPLRLPDGYTQIEALVCNRASPIIGDDDYRVPVELKVPMYVHSNDIVVVVEMVGGGLRLRLIEGELTEDQWNDQRSAFDRARSLAKGASH